MRTDDLEHLMIYIVRKYKIDSKFICELFDHSEISAEYLVNYFLREKTRVDKYKNNWSY